LQKDDAMKTGNAPQLKKQFLTQDNQHFNWNCKANYYFILTNKTFQANFYQQYGGMCSQ